MNIFSNNTITKIANNNSVRKFVSQMSNHKALLPVIMLEASVISGRSYQAYKRGGMTECRERLIDETLTAMVWFGIISWINKGFEKLISCKHVFDKKGLPEIAVDVGKDAIRNPLQHAIKNRPEIKNKISGLKFSKIALSALAGIYFSGLFLPKFYQSLTEKILRKEKQQKNNNSLNNRKIDINDFLKQTSQKTQPTFGRMPMSELVNVAAHNLEKNPIAKLLAVDVGIFAGRGYSARNNDERIELLFRDFASSFFYMFSTPLVYKGLSKFIDKFKGNNTNLDTNTAHFISEDLSKVVEKFSNVKEFEKYLFGGNDKILSQAFTQFEGETVNINLFKEKIKTITNGNDELQKTILKRAEAFLSLRPEGASKELLTMSEIKNAIKGGYVNNPMVLSKAVGVSTGGISNDPTKFIKFKDIDKIKMNIENYAKSIIEYAKNQDASKITADILTQVRNRNFIMKTIYTVSGMAVSALFLSTLIPKLQYKITEWRTGRTDFPGIKDIK